MAKNNFIMYTEYMEHIEMLEMEQRGVLMTALMCYQMEQELPEMDGMTKMCFSFIKARIDRDNEAYAEKCRKNAENGARGGRPRKEQLYTETGKLVPSGEISGAHFLYLIRDVTTGEYKIGETKNLEQRRYDIKRPTNNLAVVDYVISGAGDCQDAEREILARYKHKSTGGDWFVADDEMAREILNEWFANKPNGFLEKRPIPKKADTDTDTDTDIKEKESKKKSAPRFTPPTVQQVEEYSRQSGHHVDAQRFVDFYESKGWMVGKNKMKDWKAAVRNWAKRDTTVISGTKFSNFPERRTDYDEIERKLIAQSMGV